MVKHIPVIGPMACAWVRKKKADELADKVIANCITLVFWMMAICATVVVGWVTGAVWLTTIVTKVLVICYTLNGAVAGLGALLEADEGLSSWRAWFFDVSLSGLIWAGGVPLLSLFVIYLLLWKCRSILGLTFGFSFWEWLSHSLFG